MPTLPTPPTHVASAPASLLAAFRRHLSERGPIFVVCAALVLLGTVLRVQALGFPRGLTFDEHHFVENARNYLAGRPDWNDHPPLGKLLIALSMLVFGDTPVGWRVAPLLCGLGNIALAHALGRRLFGREAGALAAAFVAIDGFLIAYSRTALLDGMLTTIVLAVALLLVEARTARTLLAAALLAGAATSVKFSGAPLALPLLVAWANLPRGERGKGVLALLGLPGMYVAIFSIGLAITGQPAGLTGVIDASRALVTHHLGLTAMVHPLVSRWYTWFLPTRPITLRMDFIDSVHVRAMTMLGNPLLWWGSELVLAASALLLARRLRTTGQLAPRSAAAAADGFVARHGRAIGWLLLMWGSLLALWIITRRDSYIYHYLPSYTFGLILAAGALAHLHERRPALAVALLVLVAEVSLFYAPVWAQLPIARAGFNARLFLPGWR